MLLLCLYQESKNISFTCGDSIKPLVAFATRNFFRPHSTRENNLFYSPSTAQLSNTTLPIGRHRTYPQKKDIISYPYPGPQKGYYILSYITAKKRIWIYILYPLQFSVEFPFFTLSVCCRNSLFHLVRLLLNSMRYFAA
jgi:hypothetical protein